MKVLLLVKSNVSKGTSQSEVPQRHSTTAEVLNPPMECQINGPHFNRMLIAEIARNV